MSCNSEIWENFALDDLWWPQIWPHIKMTLVLSLELVKTYRVFFPLVDALRSFRVSRGGGTYVPPPPAVRRWLRPPAVRGLNRDDSPLTPWTHVPVRGAPSRDVTGKCRSAGGPDGLTVSRAPNAAGYVVEPEYCAEKIFEPEYPAPCWGGGVWTPPPQVFRG